MTDAYAPVYLLSTERSGSNLVRSILHTHSEIAAPHPFEPAYPWRNTAAPADLSRRARGNLVRDILINKYYSYQPLVETLDVDRVQERLEALDPESFLDVQQALYEAYAATVDASTWVSKDPTEWDYIDPAFDQYEDLKIVYLVRDPRDVVLSFKTSNVGPYHPFYAARRWQAEQDQGLELLEDRPDVVHRVRYEDLLRDPEAIARELCEFLGLEYEPEMLYYYDTGDAKAASESAKAFENLAVPIKSDNYDKYKEQLPREEIRLTEALTRDELETHGYELQHSSDELDGVELDPKAYETEERRLSRSASVVDWLEDTREQLTRYATRSFSYYMMLRYGLLQ